MFGFGPSEDLPQLVEELSFVGLPVVLGIPKFIGDGIDEWLNVVDHGVVLDKESADIAPHYLGDESLPGLLLLGLHGSPLLA